MKKLLPSTKTSLQLYLFLCLAVLAGLSGCHKSTANVDGLYGRWLWVKTDWTFTVSSGTAYPPALTTVILQLNSNGTFSITKNGATVADSAYQVNKNCPNGICDTLLTFQNQYAQNGAQGYYWVVGNYLASFHDNMLILAFDGPFTPAGASSIQYFVPI